MFDRAAATYERIGPPFFAYFGRTVAVLVGLREGSRVLDVACGAGAVLLAAVERIGPRGVAVGVDLSKVMLDRTCSEIKIRGISNAWIARMDALALAFPDRVFAAVFCNFALNGLPSPELALSEFDRILRPEGCVGLTISEGWWWEGDDRWRWHGAVLEALGIHIDLASRQFPTTGDLAAILTRHGFHRVSAAEESYDLAFADADEWWTWAWSHGYRQVLERMSPSQLERYRAACVEHLGVRSVQGRLRIFIAVGAKRPP